jgi:hypothetical protein
MTARVKVTDTDKGAARMLARLLTEGRVQVGVLSAPQGPPGAGSADDIHDDSPGLTLGELADFHEFGIGVPRRSFLRDWVDSAEPETRRQVLNLALRLVRGEFNSFAEALEQYGVWAVGQVQARIATNIPPPLAESTIRRKGSSVALIDTGQLRSAISYKVSKAVSFYGKFKPSNFSRG